LQYVGVREVIAVFLVVACGFIAVPQCSTGISAGVALVSLPALRWGQCQHCAVDDAGIVPTLPPMTILSLRSFVFILIIVIVAKDVARSSPVVVVIIVVFVAYVMVFVLLTLLPF
jgi:hypothetical protein